MLCQNLVQFTEYLHSKKIYNRWSSNLSLQLTQDHMSAFKYVDKLIVSVSGFSKSIYEQNHRGGNIDLVKSNLVKLARAKKYGDISTDVYVHYITFPYSHEEYELFNDFCQQYGIRIDKWKGLGDPEKSYSQMKNALDTTFNFPSTSSPLWNKPENNWNKVCPAACTPVIDCYGDAYLCCCMPNVPATYIGSFLMEDFNILQYRRNTHPICHTCKSHVKLNRQSPPLLHFMPIMRGMIKSIYNDKNKNITENYSIVLKRLENKDVYFWGSGQMLLINLSAFTKCHPVCVLSDINDGLKSVAGLPVRHPDEILNENKVLPIVIFAGESANLQIKNTIAEKYPRFTEIYSITSAVY